MPVRSKIFIKSRFFDNSPMTRRGKIGEAQYGENLQFCFRESTTLPSSVEYFRDAVSFGLHSTPILMLIYRAGQLIRGIMGHGFIGRDLSR